MRDDEAGFTLLELLVVLAIVSLLVIAVPQLMPSARQGFQARATAYELAGAIRTARALAVSSNGETRFVLDKIGTTYHADPQGDTHGLRSGVSAVMKQAFSSTETSAETIRFFPDGSSSGGFITVTGESGQSHHVKVYPLSGRVTVDE